MFFESITASVFLKYFLNGIRAINIGRKNDIVIAKIAPLTCIPRYTKRTPRVTFVKTSNNKFKLSKLNFCKPWNVPLAIGNKATNIIAGLNKIMLVLDILRKDANNGEISNTKMKTTTE